MIGKIIVGGFLVLVFLGLGVSGTINAAVAGFHTVESNSLVQQLQSQAISTIKSEATTQLNAVTNAAANAVAAKIVNRT